MNLSDKNSTKELFNFLTSKKLINPKEDYIFEIAAGNGRIIKDILCELFSKIDVLEPSQALASYIEKMKDSNPNIKPIYITSVENFYFERKYNILFAGWLVGNLTDANALSFLIKCRTNIHENGIFIIKDNLNEPNAIYSSSEMNQKIRPFKSYEMLFELSRFKIIHDEDTKDWPKRCYMLKIFILKPKN